MLIASYIKIDKKSAPVKQGRFFTLIEFVVRELDLAIDTAPVVIGQLNAVIGAVVALSPNPAIVVTKATVGSKAQNLRPGWAIPLQFFHGLALPQFTKASAASP